MAADIGEVAAGLVAAAVGATPHRPARLIDRRRLGRRFQHRGVGVGDIGRHGVALGCKAERGVIGAADPAAAIDEGIEHQIEELVGELESNLLRAGRGFAGKLIQATGEIAAGEAEQRHESRRQRAAIVEEAIDSARGTLLVLAQPYGLLRSTESGRNVQ